MKRIIFSLHVMVLFIIESCSLYGTGPSSDDSYAPLNLGDVTQIVNVVDSSTTLFKVISSKKRKDGKFVFGCVWKYGTSPYTDTLYCYTDDEYFISTEIDTVKDETFIESGNPFAEQKLAKVYPKQDDSWIHTIGYEYSTICIAERVESFDTFFGQLNDVFSFKFYDEDYHFLTTYYAYSLGWVGSAWVNSETVNIDFVASYKKVSKQTYGKLWPERNIPFNHPKNSNSLNNALRNKIIGYIFIM